MFSLKNGWKVDFIFYVIHKVFRLLHFSTSWHVEILFVFVYLNQLTCFVPSLCPPARLQVNKGVTVVDLLSFARDLEAQTDLMVS